jgi:hypothetical protein
MIDSVLLIYNLPIPRLLLTTKIPLHSKYKIELSIAYKGTKLWVN